ncbi:hypothetical protein BH10BAC3_BH10BAC3_16560 [soil metagenome]
MPLIKRPFREILLSAIARLVWAKARQIKVVTYSPGLKAGANEMQRHKGL